MTQTLESRVEEAIQIRDGAVQVKTDQVKQLAKEMMRHTEFGLARELWAVAYRQTDATIDRGGALRCLQQQALSTYKDTSRPVRERFSEALRLLDQTESLHDHADRRLAGEIQETYGLRGAACKYRWEYEGHTEWLYLSLKNYLHAYRLGDPSDPDHDLGYTGINAAFLLDRLADLEERQRALIDEEAARPDERRRQAREIRANLIAKLPAAQCEADRRAEWAPDAEQQHRLKARARDLRSWWFYLTLAEASFGMEDYDGALRWIKLAPQTPDWEKESTTRQLARLARLQADRDRRRLATMESGGAAELAGEKAAAAEREVLRLRVLQEGFGLQPQAARALVFGKIGLALSGGGFRAALYHLGVLAKLAEMDLLRHIDVLSCVSGGSIVGTHYYLELGKRLTAIADRDVAHLDYVTIVDRMVTTFKTAVQKNIRTRVAGDFFANARMAFDKNYSRTQRVGELYEEYLYRPVLDGTDQPIAVHQLKIEPKGDCGFHPKHHNWRRNAKVPMWIVNATTLNTGHNWQFTATFMGEPPGAIDPRVDSNPRLRRMYHESDDIPSDYKRFPLGAAVGASACVPGLFAPIELPGLYPGTTVRLVDGGVYDNLGITGLLEQECTVLIVSDASGQNAFEADPNRSEIPVLMRSSGLTMGTVRSATMDDVRNRVEGGRLRGAVLIHLRKGLSSPEITWTKPAQSPLPPPATGAAPSDPLTAYGILESAQRHLAAIRTDLDSFSDLEAYALMLSGYRMMEHYLDRELPGLSSQCGSAQPCAPLGGWKFLQVDAAARGASPETARLLRVLEVARHRTFKIWRLWKGLRYLLIATAILGLGLLLAAWWYLGCLTVLTVGDVVWAVVAASAGGVVAQVLRAKNMARRFLVGMALALFGFVAVGLHLRFFDRWYLEHGRVPPET